MRAWREKAGYTQAKCAEMLRVSFVTWSTWEAGTKRPRLEHAMALEKLTGGEIAANFWADSPAEREERRSKYAKPVRRKPRTPSHPPPR